MKINLDSLQKKQSKLAIQVITSGKSLYKIAENDLMLALDIQYKNEVAYVAGNLFEYPDKEIRSFVGRFDINFPYIPRFFSFREGPPLLAFYKHFIKTTSYQPKLLIIDGHGLAHPVKLGVASWLGVQANISTLGCAKNTLLEYQGDLREAKGSTLEIHNKSELVGYVLRRQEKINPVFVSAGHLIDLNTSKEVTLNLGGNYKIPDSLRIADQIARKYAENNLDNSLNVLDFGNLN